MLIMFANRQLQSQLQMEDLAENVISIIIFEETAVSGEKVVTVSMLV